MQDQIQYYQNKLAYEMDPSDLFSALETNSSIIVVDARQPFAFQKEHIPQALNLPHRDLTAETTATLNKQKTYICYCDGIGCNASTKAALKLAQLGFTVKELIGGIEWWKKDGYATQGNTPTTGDTIQCAC